MANDDGYCASQPLVDIQNYGDAEGDPRFVVTRKIGGTAPHSDNQLGGIRFDRAGISGNIIGAKPKSSGANNYRPYFQDAYYPSFHPDPTAEESNAWASVLMNLERQQQNNFMSEQNGGPQEDSPPKRSFESYQYKDGPDYDLSFAQDSQIKGQRNFGFAGEMQT